jgi:hypothetical protein
MKCDRRWWNDGRLEREQAACVDPVECLTAWMLEEPRNARDAWLEAIDAEIRAGMDKLWDEYLAWRYSSHA